MEHEIYVMEGGLQRIQLETTEYTNCNWQGTIANPTQPDLYIALKDRFEIMRNYDLCKVICNDLLHKGILTLGKVQLMRIRKMCVS